MEARSEKENGEYLIDEEYENEGARLERIISSLGNFDRFQKWLVLALSIASGLAGMPVVAMSFLAFEPPHRCIIPVCDHLGNEQLSYETPFLNFTTPYHHEKGSWHGCHHYEMAESIEPSCQVEHFNPNATVACQHGTVFNDEMFKSSIITDFNLYCAAPVLLTLPGITYMLGMLIGAISMGALADKIGRKNSIVMSGLLISSSGLVSFLAPNYLVFLIGRFFTGIGAMGSIQIAFVLGIELIGAEYRTFMGIMIQTPFALGEAMTGVLAYFIRDWRYLQLAITLPAIVMVSYKWYLPESVRWLVSKNRTEEAVAVLKHIAEVNKKELKTEDLDFLTSRGKYIDEDRPTEETTKKTVFDLLKTPNMRSRTLNMFFAWAVVTFMYYGLSFNSGNIGSNMFVSFILTMLVEIPSYLFCWKTLDWMGRKGVLILMYMIGGFSCVFSALLDPSWSVTIICLSLFGKFGASAGFAIVYVYAGELFSTDYRGVAVGACSMFARVGGLSAPVILQLFAATPTVPPIIFGVLGIICGFLIILLPETAGSRLPQTLEESENFGSDQKMTDCCLCWTKRNDSEEKV